MNTMKHKKWALNTLITLVHDLKYEAVKTGKFKDDNPKLFYLGKPVLFSKDHIEVFDNRKKINRKPVKSIHYNHLVRQINLIEYLLELFKSNKLDLFFE